MLEKPDLPKCSCVKWVAGGLESLPRYQLTPAPSAKQCPGFGLFGTVVDCQLLFTFSHRQSEPTQLGQPWGWGSIAGNLGPRHTPETPVERLRAISCASLLMKKNQGLLLNFSELFLNFWELFLSFSYKMFQIHFACVSFGCVVIQGDPTTWRTLPKTWWRRL